MKTVKLYAFFIMLICVFLLAGCPATVTNNEDKKNVSVLPAPGNVQSSNITEISVDLSWTAVSGAYGYMIYYSESENGEYKQIWSSITTSCTVNSLIPGKNSYFKVQAIKINNYVMEYGEMSNTILVITNDPTLGNIQNVNVTVNSFNINITFDSLAGANKYLIYKSNTNNFDYSKESSSNGGTNYKEDYQNMVEPNTTYYYRILAINTITKKSSNLSGIFSGTTTSSTLSLPTTFIPISKSYKIGLDWSNAVIGAAQYNIVYKQSNISAWDYASPVNSTILTYSHESVELNTIYNVKFRAVNESTGESSQIYTCNITTGNNCSFAAPTGINAVINSSTGNVDVTWNNTAGADSYRVYMSFNTPDNYSLLGNAYTNAFSQHFSFNNVKCYFKVKSISETNDNTSPLCSDYAVVNFP